MTAIKFFISDLLPNVVQIHYSNCCLCGKGFLIHLFVRALLCECQYSFVFLSKHQVEHLPAVFDSAMGL